MASSRSSVLLVLTLCAALVGSASAATISTFAGGDVGEGLDLQGTFLPGYAVYAGPGGETGTYLIQNATFENSLVAGGIDIAAPQQTDFGGPNYGVTANDTNLTNITNFVRFGGAGSPSGSVGVAITAAIVANTQYKLQLLFNEACCSNRGFDVYSEGAPIVTNFNPSVTQGHSDGTPPGALITYLFTAVDNTLNIDLVVSNPPFGDSNAIIDAVSLQVVPEPSALLLAGMAALGLVATRRRRRV